MCSFSRQVSLRVSDIAEVRTFRSNGDVDESRTEGVNSEHICHLEDVGPKPDRHMTHVATRVTPRVV